MKKQILGLAALSVAQAITWDSSLKSKDMIETKAEVQLKHHHKKHHHKKQPLLEEESAPEKAEDKVKDEKAPEVKEEKVQEVKDDKAPKAMVEKTTEAKEVIAPKVEKDNTSETKDQKPVKDNSSEGFDDKSPEYAEEFSVKKHHHKKHHHEAKEQEQESLAEKKVEREGCTSLGCPEGSAAKDLSFTTEEAISGTVTGKMLDNATAGNWAQVNKPGSLAEKKREGCTSLGCPQGSAAKHMTFTTEDAVSGVPTTGNILDSAMEGNWAQVNKPGSNSTMDASQKKTAVKSVPACNSYECKTGTAAKYTVPKDHNGDQIYDYTEAVQKKSQAKIGKWTPVKKVKAADPAKAKKADPDCTSFDCTTFLDKPPKGSATAPLEYKVPSVAAQIASMGPESAKLVPAESKSKSDPICSSSGWCGPNIPEKPKKGDAGYPVEYQTGLPLDKDIRDSESNLKDTEDKLGPMKIGNTKAALQQANKAIAKVSHGINLNQLQSKTAVKAQVQAKLMTRNEKAQSFAQLRERMMSNWGTK